MEFADPRERYDDILETETREVLDPDAFEEAAASEPADVGWVVTALAFDEAGRVLLIDQPWADGWIAPGGVPEPAESLTESVTRELLEETGVEISPVRPHAVDDLTVENERTGETDGWMLVVYEARAETTAIDRDPAVDDETIRDADWFDSLPDVYNPEVVEPVYERCVGVIERRHEHTARAERGATPGSASVRTASAASRERSEPGFAGRERSERPGVFILNFCERGCPQAAAGGRGHPPK